MADTLTIPPKTYAQVLEMPMAPFAFHRVRFESRCAGPAYWQADFFDAAGGKNYADNNSGIEPSDGWTANESVFFARADAVRGTLGFVGREAALEVRAAAMEPVDRGAALAWLEGRFAGLPACASAVCRDRRPRLERVLERLRRGGTLRWAALGDSLSNDLLNGMGHLRIEEAFPGLRIEMIHANGPEKFANNYNDDAVLERLVWRRRPDVLMVGGLSHVGQEEAIRAIVARTRAALGDLPALYTHVDAGCGGLEATEAFLERLDAFGRADDFAVLDLSAAWRGYLRASGRPHAWYMRDGCHVNDRGKIVLGRIFASCFAG